jgi:short-subunit dehydrogenase
MLSLREKNRLHTQYGPYALVTGASSGIGQELAMLLASAQFQLVLCATDPDRLQATARNIQNVHKTEIKIIATDLGTPAGVAHLIAQTAGIPIGLAVLAAGFGTSGFFAQSLLQNELQMLRVNCEAVMQLTHHYSAQFAAQRRGGIILFSSIVAFQGVPHSAHYAATKAYVQTLAEGIAAELKPLGVDVLAVAPGPVNTRFAQRAGMHMAQALSATDVGEPILTALGRRTTVYPGYLSQVLHYALSILPRFARTRVMGKVMAGMAGSELGKLP